MKTSVVLLNMGLTNVNAKNNFDFFTNVYQTMKTVENQIIIKTQYLEPTRFKYKMA